MNGTDIFYVFAIAVFVAMAVGTWWNTPSSRIDLFAYAAALIFFLIVGYSVSLSLVDVWPYLLVSIALAGVVGGWAASIFWPRLSKHSEPE